MESNHRRGADGVFLLGRRRKESSPVPFTLSMPGLGDTRPVVVGRVVDLEVGVLVDLKVAAREAILRVDGERDYLKAKDQRRDYPDS